MQFVMFMGVGLLHTYNEYIVPVYNLLGNLDNKAHHSILVIIIVSKYGTICLSVVPGKNSVVW